MNHTESSSFRTSIFKRIDDPWIGLLLLAGVTFVSSIIATIILCCLWRRHQQHQQFHNQGYILGNQPNGQRTIPIHIDDDTSRKYLDRQVCCQMPTETSTVYSHLFVI
jgi:hypothetical protein